LLEENGQLVRVTREVNKDTVLHPLVRWQFRGLEEQDRKAFLFENVTDSRARRYQIPVAVSALAGSQAMYNLGLNCSDEEVHERWNRALAQPLPPRLVETAPVQEVVHAGASLLEHGGLDELPVPISTPGFDNAPYLTAAMWVAKDPESGIQNLGGYRGQLKGPLKTAVNVTPTHDFSRIWEKYNAMGAPMEVAAVIGGAPSLFFAAVELVPFGIDEVGVAGALDGEPIDVVRCKTVDLQVPADAEIVIEGKVRTDLLEPEGAFGEAHGYVDPRNISFIFEVTAITHRRNPVFLSVISQLTPSESSKSKQSGYEAECIKYLRDDCGFKSVTHITLTEDLLNRRHGVVRMRKRDAYEPMNVLYAMLAWKQAPKMIVVVDDDIDSDDPLAVNWAIVTRCQPHRDVKIIYPRPLPFGPIPHVADGVRYDRQDSALLIDATQKSPLPPIALPAKKHMEEALELWKALELPPLKPRSPWYGYSLGDWPEVHAREAELAVQGRYYETGDALAQQAVKVEPGTRLTSLKRHQR
jgi:4-hydroxy-3-polyprenylbenzoate decarboxylase